MTHVIKSFPVPLNDSSDFKPNEKKKNSAVTLSGDTLI